MVFEGLLNPVLNPLLEAMGYFPTLLLLVFCITMIITLIYKYTTNQSLMKDLKKELKEFQKEIKQLKSNPEQAMKVQKKMMQTNSKYMMHSFRPMLFTFLPIIILFGWMSAHLAYYPIMPDQEFSVTMNFDSNVEGFVKLTIPDGLESLNGLERFIQANNVVWTLKGKPGEYLLTYEYNKKTYSNEIIVSNNKEYAQPVVKIKKDGIDSIVVSNKKVQPLKNMILIGQIPWIGNFGWLGTYILFSLFFSISIRKILKVY
jgi:uncharacterized membrane protein (DUF106 family)